MRERHRSPAFHLPEDAKRRHGRKIAEKKECQFTSNALFNRLKKYKAKEKQMKGAGVCCLVGEWESD